MQSSFSPLTLPENTTNYTTLEDSSGSKSYDLAHGHNYRTNQYGDGLLVNSCFQRAVNYNKNPLDNKLPNYDHAVLRKPSKMFKRTEAQMKPSAFDPFDPISMIEFLCSFKLACDNCKIHEGAGIWLFHFIVKKSTSSTLHMRLASKHRARMIITSTDTTKTLITHPQAVNY